MGGMVKVSLDRISILQKLLGKKVVVPGEWCTSAVWRRLFVELGTADHCKASAYLLYSVVLSKHGIRRAILLGSQEYM